MRKTHSGNFRVHFDDGTKITIKAETPEQARKIAKKKSNSPITKIKHAHAAAEGEKA